MSTVGSPFSAFCGGSRGSSPQASAPPKAGDAGLPVHSLLSLAVCDSPSKHTIKMLTQEGGQMIEAGEEVGTVSQ